MQRFIRPLALTSAVRALHSTKIHRAMGGTFILRIETPTPNADRRVTSRSS